MDFLTYVTQIKDKAMNESNEAKISVEFEDSPEFREVVRLSEEFRVACQTWKEAVANMEKLSIARSKAWDEYIRANKANINRKMTK